MINVGRVLNNPRFSQSFTVYRKSGSWVAGRWNGTESAITMNGVIIQASETDLEMVPEGDKQKGNIAVYAISPLYQTTAQGTSDEIEWRGNRYRVMPLTPYADYGYYKAIATKMDPSTGVET